MEAATLLNAEKKSGVKVSILLAAVLQSQIAQLEDAIKLKAEFQMSYGATLSACNGCHREAVVKFIHIVRPARLRLPISAGRWMSNDCGQ